MRKILGLLLVVTLTLPVAAFAADKDHHDHGPGGPAGPAAQAQAQLGVHGPSAQLNLPGASAHMNAPSIGLGTQINGDGHHDDHNPPGGFHGQGPQHIEVGPTINFGGVQHEHGHMGDRSYDRNGIGFLDESRYHDSHDDHWRYHNYNGSWFYWTPNRNWVYWSGGTWVVYDPNTYVTPTFAGPAPAAAIVSPVAGPYYEDGDGFYSLQGGVKVYDPSILRQH